MFDLGDYSRLTKPELYEHLAAQMAALLESESDGIANAANASALIWHALPDINWVGFYFYKKGELVLGPFQGKPACVRISLGQGVCGTAASTGKTQVVGDVREFPGHIACDADSRSEIVIPLLVEGELFGVLDIDSPKPGRFDVGDQAGLERLAAVYLWASHRA